MILLEMLNTKKKSGFKKKKEIYPMFTKLDLQTLHLIIINHQN